MSHSEHTRFGPRLWPLALIVAPTGLLAHVLDPARPAPTVFAWSFEPFVSVALALSFTLYACGFWRLHRRAAARSRRQRCRQALAFVGGWAVLVLALASPLDALGAALFSAHMVQHELLMLLAAPLLVLGRPLGVWVWALPAPWRIVVGRAIRWRILQTVWVGITAPLGAWLLHAAALWLWHVPWLFQKALLEPWIHTLQHTSFLATALLFWWAILARPDRAEGAGSAMLSLFTTMVHTGALGALLALSPGLWYPLYAGPSTTLGFDPLQDQQMGGLVMWVPGGLAYLVGALVIAARWLLHRPAMRNASALDVT